MNCNTCIHINITETEQYRLQLSGQNFPYHFCKKYKSRVFHMNTHRGNNGMLYPCSECEKEKGASCII